jgi:hypothetical protein
MSYHQLPPRVLPIDTSQKVHLNNEQDKNIKVSIEHGIKKRRSTYGKSTKTSGEKYQHIIDNIERDNTEAAYLVGGAVAIGAVTGSIVGSAFPGIGTVVGTGVGAALGTGVGFLDGLYVSWVVLC